jgi:Glu-tRNA(Gln) amidotransferase subunit E-like FAD-binding protein
MSKILQKLRGEDLRSIGKADEVVQDILNDPSLFQEVFEGMLNKDPVIRMRSADAIEKVSAKRPEYLRPFKSKLINQISKIEQQEVRWHTAQMFSYIETSKIERNKIIKILLSYIETDESKIVKTFSMQTLADFAEKDEQIKPRIRNLIKGMIKNGSPAIVSRGKKLLKQLN